MKAYETPRLILRNWRKDDLAGFAEMNADLEVMEFLPKILTREESDAYAEKIKQGFEKHGFGLWAVVEKSTGSFIGFVGLSVPSFEASFTPCVEVGWRLARRAWGKGYATEAAEKALEIGFEGHGLEEIVSFTVPGNKGSRRVMEKIGLNYQIGGEFNHPNLPGDHPLSRHVLYRIKRSTWEAKRK